MDIAEITYEQKLQTLVALGKLTFEFTRAADALLCRVSIEHVDIVREDAYAHNKAITSEEANYTRDRTKGHILTLKPEANSSLKSDAICSFSVTEPTFEGSVNKLFALAADPQSVLRRDCSPGEAYVEYAYTRLQTGLTWQTVYENDRGRFVTERPPELAAL